MEMNSIKEIDYCQFNNWYNLFHKYSFKSKIIELPDEFLEYLEEDGISMPNQIFHKTDSEENVEDKSANITHKDPEESKVDNVNPIFNELEEQKEKEILGDKTENIKYHFDGLEEEIIKNIEELGGTVFVKLNWTSPKDSSWLVHALKAQTVRDVFTLIKSSQFILHDYQQCYKGASDYTQDTPAHPDKLYLVLRKYYSLKGNGEFRCFVYKGRLIGISQRKCEEYQGYNTARKEEIKLRITQFMKEIMFPILTEHQNELRSFVLDIYIDIKPREKVWIVDINPLVESTDSLLFDWKELGTLGLEEGDVKMRVQEEEAGVLPDPMAQYRVPLEFMNEELREQMGDFFQNMSKK